MFDKENRRLGKFLSDREYELLAAYRKSLTNTRNMLAEIFDKYGEKPTFAQLQKYGRLLNYEKQILEEMRSLTGVSLRKTENLMKDMFAESYYGTGYVLETSLGIKLGFNQINQNIVEAALDNPLDRVGWKFRMKGSHEKAVQQIKSELTQSLIRGDSYTKTARNIKEKFDQLANNVLRIVRTENHRVQVAARVKGIERAEASADRLGIEMERVIVSVLDGRTRPQSRIMDGKVADENGLFTYPDGRKALPGQTGNPAWDINDRETVILRIKENPANARLPVDESLKEYRTYEQWYNGRIRNKK